MTTRDPFEWEDEFEDSYFDGEELDDDLLYLLYDEDEYDYEIFNEDEDAAEI